MKYCEHEYENMLVTITIYTWFTETDIKQYFFKELFKTKSLIIYQLTWKQIIGMLIILKIISLIDIFILRNKNKIMYLFIFITKNDLIYNLNIVTIWKWLNWFLWASYKYTCS